MAKSKSRAARTKRTSSSRSRSSDESLGLRLLWLASTLTWAFVVASLLGFDRADPPSSIAWPVNDPVINWCGPVGAYLAYQLFNFLGWGAWLVLGLLGVGLAKPLFGSRVEQPVIRAIGSAFLLAGFAGMVNLLVPAAGPLGHMPGGELGLVISHELSIRFGSVGAALWLILIWLIGMVLVFDRLVLALPSWIISHVHERVVPVARDAGSVAVASAGTSAAATAKASSGFVGTIVGGLAGGLAGMVRGRKALAVKLTDLEEQDIDEIEGTDQIEADARAPDTSATAATRKRTSKAAKGRKPVRRIELEPKARLDTEALDAQSVATKSSAKTASAKAKARAADELDDDDDDLPGAPQVFTEDQLREKIAKLPVRFAGANRKIATDDDLRDLQNEVSLEGYKFPGLDLLVDPEEDFSDKLESIVREQAEALESAMRQYRIDGEVVGIESGPVITQYDVRLAPGTKVAALNAVSSDIARALKAINIRIVANQVGRDTVGIEVPNPAKEKVRLKELMSNSEAFAKMKLPMFLGKDAAGDPLIEDLTKMPHMLIAGTTGSGKSVCMNTIIMSFLYTKKPNELKLVLVDPKMVEMGQFKDIPHLMCPVITEMSKAAAILEWACKKMDERYELLAEAGCRDLASYNALEWEELRERMDPQSEEEEARIPRQLPYMVFVIDELADLMMTNKEVEGSIVRIAQKARAVGIHLILATQRPQANVVTGLIKSNLPCRISFKVASGMDSRIVLDQKGGELLLGQGDMLFLSPRSSNLTRAQGTLVDDKEIRKAVRFLKDIAKPSFERQLVQLRSGNSDLERIEASKNNSSASLAAAQEDPMFDRAVEIVLETRRGSVSLLQRRLAIGYTRASRLIDLMGIAGIISEHKGSVARDVLITPEVWEQMKAMADEQAAQNGSGPVFGSDRSLFPKDTGETTTPSDTHTASGEEDADDEAPFDANNDTCTEIDDDAVVDDEDAACVDDEDEIVEDEWEEELEVDELEDEEEEPESDEWDEEVDDEFDEEEEYEDDYEYVDDDTEVDEMAGRNE